MPEAPVLSDAGWLVAPVTPEEREATGIYLEWLGAVGKDRKALADRLVSIKDACEKRLTGR